MNNAQYFKSGKRLLEAFRLLTETCRAEGIPAETTMPALADFAVCGHVSTALCYSIGEIVQYKSGDGIRYGKVRKYDRGYGCPSTARDCIRIETDLSLAVPADDPEKYRTHIPQELLNLAKREITESNLLKAGSLPATDFVAEGGEK